VKEMGVWEKDASGARKRVRLEEERESQVDGWTVPSSQIVELEDEHPAGSTSNAEPVCFFSFVMPSFGWRIALISAAARIGPVQARSAAGLCHCLVGLLCYLPRWCSAVVASCSSLVAFDVFVSSY
jgi:hypothetical protein